MFEYNNLQFEILEDSREVFNKEVFIEKYTEVLDKYDYIVGDFSGEQLRLKGFYDNKKMGIEKHVSYIEYYIHAFCIYGAPYYILKKTKVNKKSNSNNKNRRSR